MLRLRTPYCLAVVDIDHFKRCNDTYGHDVGDQVLRLVAANLAGVGGGGQAYRFGGEEFTILFSGKSLSDVTAHLERLRLTIQSAEFRMRGQDRRQIPRGPDRRKEKPAGTRKRKDGLALHVTETPSPATLSVTVSIGVATSESEECAPQQVLETADKALYRAKENGRNRVEVGLPKRRLKTKAAGIA
jgi:PleD family two-component response regulator